MSTRSNTSAKRQPARDPAPRTGPASVQIVDLANLSGLLFNKKSSQPTTARPRTALRRSPRLVNWPLVAGIGVMAWLCVVGMVIGGWALSRPSANPDPVAQVESLPVVVASSDSAPPVSERKSTALDPVAKPKPSFDVAVATAKKGAPEDDNRGKLPPADEKDERVGVLPPDLPKVKPTSTCGTTIDFYSDPDEAFAKAKIEKKVVFIVHVAGNFEDSKFT